MLNSFTRRKPQTPVEELEQQNREMLLTLEELRRKKTELEEADLRKNEFLAMLAHELRNPLSAITLSIEVAERGAADTRERTFAVVRRQTRAVVAHGERSSRRFAHHARKSGTADGGRINRFVD